MLDNKDKKWICDTMDKRLESSENRTHRKIDEVDNRLCQRIDEVDNRLTQKIDEVDNRLCQRIDEVDSRLCQRIDEVDNRLSQKIDEVIQQVQEFRVYIENTDEKYWKLVSEYIPDAAKSYGSLEEEQLRQKDELYVLRAVAKDHSKRINTLEDIVCR